MVSRFLIDESYTSVLSDIEIINIVETELNDLSNKVLDMNSVNATCKNLLLENGKEQSDTNPNYKKYLNDLVQQPPPSTPETKVELINVSKGNIF